MDWLQPKAPIPDPLLGSETGSFANNTVLVRLPEIGRRTIEANDFPEQVNQRLESLIQEIPSSRVRPLKDEQAPDWKEWLGYVRVHTGKNWLEIPWFFAETYFYRRILEATGYFLPGENLQGVDPFHKQKEEGLLANQKAICTLGDQLESWLVALEDGNIDQQVILTSVLLANLWGNQADLSMWPTQSQARPGQLDVDQQKTHLLVDDLIGLAGFLTGFNEVGSRVGVILDNAGVELVHDLVLADYLLSSRSSVEVQFYLKAHPTFVSDAMKVDVLQAIEIFRGLDHASVKAMAHRLEGYIKSRRLTLVEDYFWNSPLAGWQMPVGLRQDLAKFDLVFSKGDANYRRLLGDRHWQFTTPIEDILNYFPTPLVVFRVLKSEVVAGLHPNQPDGLNQQDPDWLVDGNWGMIQFVNLV